MAVDVYAALKDLISKIMGDPATAAQYAADPHGTLVAQGITDGDLSQINVPELVGECAAGMDLPESTQQAMQSYSSGTPVPASSPVAPPAATAHQSTQEVVQHLNYVTYKTYEGDTNITQQLINQENYDYSTNIDNSVNVDGNNYGDIDVNNVNATGDGAVAAGDDIDNVITGDGSQIIDGDNYGQANTGDGAVLIGGDNDGAVNTGEFTGVQAGDDVTNAVVGDGNQTAQVGDDADNSVFNFGGGDVTNFGDAQISDSAISVGGGEATNVSDNFLDEGSALSVNGDANGHFESVEIHEETHVAAYDSNVATEQGAGNQHVDQAQELEDEAAHQL